MTTLGERLKYVREQLLQLSQADLAGRLVAEGGLSGITNVSVMRYEKGLRMPGADYVRAVAQVAGLDLAWLLTGEGEAVEGATEKPEKPDAPAVLPYDLARESADLAQASAIPDPVLRMLEREGIIAVIRTQGMREAAWAARLSEQNAAARAAERERAAERTRALIAEAERTGVIPAELYRAAPEPTGPTPIPVEPSGAELSGRR